MSFFFHELQDIFFHRLHDLLLEKEIEAKSLDLIDLSDLKINNWRILFPTGLTQMMLNFDKWQSKKVIERLANEEFTSKKAIIARSLDMKITQISSKSVFLKQQIFFAYYTNHLLALEAAFYFCNLIWKFVGDKSLDFSFYSKRLSLFFIYSASVFFYCGDNSESEYETKNFIEEMVENFSSLHILKEKLKSKINIQDIPILRYIFQ